MTNFKKKPIYSFFKRVFDIFCSFLALLLLSWLLVILGIGVKVTGKGPIIYRSLRVGKNGKVFTFYKFRSMIDRADEHLDELQKFN